MDVFLPTFRNHADGFLQFYSQSPLDDEHLDRFTCLEDYNKCPSLS